MEKLKSRANSRDNASRLHAGTKVYREPREERPLASRQSWYYLVGLMANDENYSCRTDLHNLLWTNVSVTIWSTSSYVRKNFPVNQTLTLSDNLTIDVDHRILSFAMYMQKGKLLSELRLLVIMFVHYDQKIADETKASLR